MEPKIRLKGYSGEWVETKFDSFAKIRRGLTYSPSNITAKGIRVLRSSNINEDTFVTSDEDVFVQTSCVNIPLANDGDILITAANGSPRLVGKHSVVETYGSKMVPGGFMVLAMTNEPYFLNTCMSSPWYKKFLITGVAGGNGAIGNLNKTALSDSVFFIPDNKDERDSLASYFQHLDSLIQSTSKKIDSLKQVKAASLQSMFPQEGETTPRVRFKGFDGDFEVVQASKVFKTFNEKNRPDLPVLSATQDKGMVTREAIGYNIFHNKSNEATYKHILPGQFVIHLRSFQGGFAHSNIEGIASPAYTIMEFKDKGRHYDLYWKYIFMSKEFIKRLELITYGIRDGRSISFEEFSEMNFVVPSYQEQLKIASYFTNLDEQITLQSQRLEKLKQIKSACLDNMFV